MKYCEDKVTEFSLLKITDIAPNLATNVNVFNRDELGERIRLEVRFGEKRTESNNPLKQNREPLIST